MSKVASHGNISPYVEVLLLRMDGSTVDVELGSTPCIYQNKQVAQAVFRDISKRKMIEKALIESEDKFRMLAETTAAAIIIFQGPYIVYANQAAQILSGYTFTELQNMNFWDIIHPDYRERSKDWGMRRQRGEDIPSHFELPILNKNNEIRWIDYTATVIDYQEAKAVLGTGIDITDRKCAEDKLLTYQRQLQSLASELSLAEERERRRLAVALHENIAQNLAVRKMKISELRDMTKN
jgi:PAS domain S-box-containing protein